MRFVMALLLFSSGCAQPGGPTTSVLPARAPATATRPKTEKPAVLVHVIDQQGSRIPGALVWLCPEFASGITTQAVVTDREGVARFHSLSAGPYRAHTAIAGFRQRKPLPSVLVTADSQALATIHLELYWSQGDTFTFEAPFVDGSGPVRVTPTPTPLPCRDPA